MWIDSFCKDEGMDLAPQIMQAQQLLQKLECDFMLT
jgi:hypothetical protein